VLVTRALLLRKVAFRESDAMLTLFTADHGKLSAVARGAARSQKRFGGALEPIHTLRVELNPRRSEGFELGSCSLECTRLTLTKELVRLEAAGTALSWVRKAAVELEPEPAVWDHVHGFLDRLDSPEAVDCQHLLVSLGLALLTAWGWGLELQSCVRCGKVCPERRAAFVDAAVGGVICTACGGARMRLEGGTRARLTELTRGTPSALSTQDASIGLDLVEAALSAHADIH
jgi:DNA repair protein RecO (recombination protein O)